MPGGSLHFFFFVKEAWERSKIFINILSFRSRTHTTPFTKGRIFFFNVNQIMLRIEAPIFKGAGEFQDKNKERNCLCHYYII